MKVIIYKDVMELKNIIEILVHKIRKSKFLNCEGVKNMNIKKSDVLCCQGSARYNEDIVGVTPWGAWVLDGATGLNNKNLVAKDSDAKWYVSWWNEYLHNNIKNDKSLKNIMLSGIKDIKHDYYKQIGENKIEKLDTPSSSISIIKFYENKLEYFMLGDCSIHLEYDENTIIIKDKILCELDKVVYNQMEKLPDLAKLSFESIKQRVISTIIENRLKRNTKEGYWILEFDEHAISEAIHGEIYIDKGIKLMLASDGFSCISDRYKLIEDEKILETVENRGVGSIYNELRAFEEKDFSTTKFPRFKIKDDCSCVYLDIEYNL